MWPIFVISLKDQLERRGKITAQLKNFDLCFEFIDAIDGRFGIPTNFEYLIDRPNTEVFFGRSLSDAEYACALSHMSVYQIVESEKLPGAIVLEDDARLLAGFEEIMRSGGYRDYDFLQFDYSKAYVWRSSKTEISEDLDAFRLFRNVSRATGYSISARASTHVLCKGLPLISTADWPCDMLPVGAWAVSPRIVKSADQYKIDSAIEPSRSRISLPKFPSHLQSLNYNKWRANRILRLILMRAFLTCLS